MKISGTYISALKQFLERRLSRLKKENLEHPGQLPLDTIADALPYYLTKDQKDGLSRALRDFPENANYYYPGLENNLLQGDGSTKLQVFNFQDGERAAIAGIILSNTCDVSPDNLRDLPAKIVFAPIIALSSYRKLLERANIPANRIESKFDAIRMQRITNIFYLPPGGQLIEEHIAILDDIHSMPLVVFRETSPKIKLFSLSQLGFYLFVFKLSVHFCRLHENVARY